MKVLQINSVCGIRSTGRICTDIGTDAVGNGYGLWCESADPADFTACVDQMNQADQAAMGMKARTYLEKNFTAQRCYQIVSESI